MACLVNKRQRALPSPSLCHVVSLLYCNDHLPPHCHLEFLPQFLLGLQMLVALLGAAVISGDGGDESEGIMRV